MGKLYTTNILLARVLLLDAFLQAFSWAGCARCDVAGAAARLPAAPTAVC